MSANRLSSVMIARGTAALGFWLMAVALLVGSTTTVGTDFGLTTAWVAVGAGLGFAFASTAAEVSPSTFFRYFPTKEDVLLYDSFDPVLIEAFRRQPADLGPIQAIRAAFRSVFDAMPAEERFRQGGAQRPGLWRAGPPHADAGPGHGRAALFFRSACGADGPSE